MTKVKLSLQNSLEFLKPPSSGITMFELDVVSYAFFSKDPSKGIVSETEFKCISLVQSRINY